MWDEEDNNPYGSFNPDEPADHNGPGLTSACETSASTSRWC